MTMMLEQHMGLNQPSREVKFAVFLMIFGALVGEAMRPHL